MTGAPSRVPRLLPLTEVARTLQVSVKTIRRWMDCGELRFHRIGRQIRISEEDLSAFINRKRI